MSVSSPPASCAACVCCCCKRDGHEACRSGMFRLTWLTDAAFELNSDTWLECIVVLYQSHQGIMANLRWLFWLGQTADEFVRSTTKRTRELPVFFFVCASITKLAAKHCSIRSVYETQPFSVSSNCPMFPCRAIFCSGSYPRCLKM